MLAQLALALALAYLHHPALTAVSSVTDTNGLTDREMLSAEVHNCLRGRGAPYTEPGLSRWVLQDGTTQRLTQPAAAAVSLPKSPSMHRGGSRLTAKTFRVEQVEQRSKPVRAAFLGPVATGNTIYASVGPAIIGIRLYLRYNVAQLTKQI